MPRHRLIVCPQVCVTSACPSVTCPGDHRTWPAQVHSYLFFSPGERLLGLMLLLVLACIRVFFFSYSPMLFCFAFAPSSMICERLFLLPALKVLDSFRTRTRKDSCRLTSWKCYASEEMCLREYYLHITASQRSLRFHLYTHPERPVFGLRHESVTH